MVLYLNLDNDEILTIGTSSTDKRILLHQPIILWEDPIDNYEATTKQYVDNKRVCNNVGLIPQLTRNTDNRNGYIATASSEYSAAYQAFYAFNFSTSPYGGANEWSTFMVSTNFWIKIQLPVATTIWKFQLTGRFATSSPSYFNNWVLDGSNDNVNFNPLYASNTIINSTMHEFVLNPVPTVAYLYYRIFVFSCTAGNNPGLSYFQLFSVDKLV